MGFFHRFKQWKWMVGSFWGLARFQVWAVSFREGTVTGFGADLLGSVDSRFHHGPNLPASKNCPYQKQWVNKAFLIGTSRWLTLISGGLVFGGGSWEGHDFNLTPGSRCPKAAIPLQRGWTYVYVYVEALETCHIHWWECHMRHCAARWEPWMIGRVASIDLHPSVLCASLSLEMSKRWNPKAFGSSVSAWWQQCKALR